MGERVLVTGGGGFLGKALCRRLLQEGHEVIALGRGEYADLQREGVQTVRADLSREASRYCSSFEGVSAVFHTAAKVEMWGRYKDFFDANVLGTRHVVECCRQARVPQLIFTSSPSVIADGRDLCGVDESYPYPKHYSAHYPATKAQAERELLAESSAELATIALRPHLIFGPGDTNLIPSIIERARTGKLVQIGAGNNMTDLTFIDDCVSAHIAAWRALRANPSVAGKAFFISQGEPVNLWGWVNEVLQRSGFPAVKNRLPSFIARGVAWMLEGMAKLLPGSGEPALSRFVVEEMATSHYFNITAARRDLGFNPVHSIQQAMELTFAAGDSSRVGLKG